MLCLGFEGKLRQSDLGAHCARLHMSFSVQGMSHLGEHRLSRQDILGHNQ